MNDSTSASLFSSLEEVVRRQVRDFIEQIFGSLRLCSVKREEIDRLCAIGLNYSGLRVDL